MKSWTRWKDWMIGIAGLWLLASPWVLGASETATILWTAVVLGVLIALAAVWALISPTTELPEWTNAVLGVLAVISPWVLQYTDQTSASWNAWIVGVVVVFLAGWALPDARNARDAERASGRPTKAG